LASEVGAAAGRSQRSAGISNEKLRCYITASKPVKWLLACQATSTLDLGVLSSMHGKGLVGKIALVTGASSGIGQAIAIRLAQEGCNVAINYRKDVRSPFAWRRKAAT